MDTYDNYKGLSRCEREGRDYHIHAHCRDSSIAIIAPHGGEIEPGTSEIAKDIARDDLTCYCFEGIRRADNYRYLHLASTRFDEPVCLDLCRRARIVITVHGASGTASTVFVGGRHAVLGKSMVTGLKTAGFHAARDGSRHHPGLNHRNLCNLGQLAMGVQLEITRGLRQRLFTGLDRRGRETPAPALTAFSRAVRRALSDFRKDHS